MMVFLFSHLYSSHCFVHLKVMFPFKRLDVYSKLESGYFQNIKANYREDFDTFIMREFRKIFANSRILSLKTSNYKTLLKTNRFAQASYHGCNYSSQFLNSSITTYSILNKSPSSSSCARFIIKCKIKLNTNNVIGDTP